eukprot:TRINITY_DN1462_c1_g1_i1.p1 TRINITY_DN1462_c1_g1~~TRINITY_DN1462_c1_g1_i1.p1  ORF type:complete len:371 (+),score=140.29 TRINITY_DN1462_c1_g1_i1:78-1190(+)
MARAAVLASASLCASAHPADTVKQVLNTWWWPPGTEKNIESVGILSHNVVWMTGMMEHNSTQPKTVQQELQDDSDIAAAANLTVDNFTDCLVNCYEGRAAEMTSLFKARLPKTATLTVVEQKGEYSSSLFNSSTTCTAVATGHLRPLSAGIASGTHATGPGLLWLTATSAGGQHSTADQVNRVVEDAAAVVKMAGGGGQGDFVDCTLYIDDIAKAPAAEAAFAQQLPHGAAAPAFLVVEAGAGSGNVTLHCVAAPGAKKVSVGHGAVTAVAARGFVWASVGARQVSGKDGFDALENVFTAAGSKMKDAVNCRFFVRDLSKMNDVFDGFRAAFNKANPPPPSRTEFSGPLGCTECAVTMRCIAALPSAHQP